MTTPTVLISGARILDPASKLDAEGHVGIRDGAIAHVGTIVPDGYDERVDGTGLWLIPGIVDLAARLREPGAAHKATIRGESAAAAAAGITTLCLPPDTQPVVDTPAVVEWIAQRAHEGPVDVRVLGALTRGLGGQALADMGALAQAGCVGVSQAHAPLPSTLLMRRALEYAHTYRLTVHVVALDQELAGGGCAHEGPVATRLGLAGIPASAETAALTQWLALAEQTGARVHFGRLSTARGVDLLAKAKSRGLPVTGDVAAHQLYLTEADLEGFNPDCHVRPPLRSEADRSELCEAVRRGVIDAIVSDHQPHERDAKTDPFPLTEPGISALETLLPLTLALIHRGWLPPLAAIAKLTLQPAHILGLPCGRIAVGAPANLALVDPHARWTLEPAAMRSAGRNTPFAGREFQGRAVRTWCRGRHVATA